MGVDKRKLISDEKNDANCSDPDKYFQTLLYFGKRDESPTYQITIAALTIFGPLKKNEKIISNVAQCDNDLKL